MNEVEIPLKVTGIGAMKAELRELKGAIADATDPAAIAALSQQAGVLKDKIMDANEAVNVFASGSKFEQVSNSIGGIKDSLLSLDFEEANEKAKVFSQALGKLNPGDLAKSFKGLTGTITTIGGAFVKLGLQILANPIFLLVAVITVIVVAIGFFLKKIGVLDAVFKALMAPINAVVQGFKDLTDAMGLTDNAAEENAEAVKESSEKNIESIKQQSKAQQDLFNLTKDMSDEEIAMLEEKYGIQVDTSQSIFDLKQEEIDGLQAENQRQIDSLNLKKELTEEDKKRLAELNKTKFDLGQQEIANEANRINTIKNLNMSLDKQIEMLQAKQIKGESERASAMLDIQLKEALSKADQQMKEARQLGDTAAIAKAQQLRALIITDFERQRLEITNKGNAAVAKSNTSAAVKSVQDTKSNEAKKLDTMRKEGANAIAVLEKNNASEEAIQAERLKQLDAELAYVKTNKAKLYKLAVDQDAAILKLENDRKKIVDKALAEQEKEDNANALARLERAVLNAKEEGNAVLLAQKDLLTEQSRQKMLSLEVGSDAALLLADETAKGLDAIDKQIVISDKEKNLKILASAQLVAETKLSNAAFELERFKGTTDQQIAEQEKFLTTTLATLDAQRIAELAALNLSEEEKAAIKQKYDQAEIVATETKTAKIEEIEKAARDKLFANIDAGFQLASTAASAITSIQDINTKKKLKGIEKGSKEEEKILKQQFDQQKKMNIAMAVINGAQAITSILAQYPKFDGGFAMVAALAGSVISTAASIATIASTSFEGGGAAPSIPDATSLTGGSSTGGMATPSASLFGSNNNLNNVGGQQEGQAGQNITVTAIVSETEMTDTQNRVNKIKRNAEL
jgi:hypothetical protein